jgi:outer membrane protein OmpA-like peptidoglycan-associated protein
MVAPVVMSFITKHLRDTGMSLSGLSGLLQREGPTFRSSLPAGLGNIFEPGAARVAAAAPVVTPPAGSQTSSGWVLPALACAALALGLGWLLNHSHRPAVQQSASAPASAPASVPRGEASRFGTPAPAATTTCSLPADLALAEGVQSRLLAFLQDNNAKTSDTNWFVADRLSFGSGSAKVQPGSQPQINDIATILSSCPGVRMTVAGYTDNSGNADANLRLSRNRANAIVGALVNKGISADRLTAEGLGEQDPVADNSTPQGRSQNRRVAMLVTQK